MFTIQKSNKLLALFIMLLGFASFAQAQENRTKDGLKDFLSSSEFGIQRKVVKEAAIGQKGLLSGSVEKKDIKDVLSVDLIDPFENKTVVGTKTDLNKLDDGIEFAQEDEITESINSFRGKIEEYFEKIEQQQDIDVVNLLNHLKINQIISSPMKYVVIQGKKYEEEDTITVRVNRFGDDSDFQNMLNSVKVETENSEEAELLEEMKADAVIRYNSLTSNLETALNIVKITISEISKQEVSFIIDEKTYKLIMKK